MTARRGLWRLCRSPWFWVPAVPMLGFVLAVPIGSVYYAAAGGEACIKCHELELAFQSWARSPHRDSDCSACHGSIFTTDSQFHLNNARQVVLHVQGRVPERLKVGQADIDRGLNENCGRCHAVEYAAWKAGPHGASYGRVFLDPKHNSRRTLSDHCLQCHGMFYPGGIRDLVQPLDQTGPWTLADAAIDASHPSIPCLACHQVHREGEPRARMADPSAPRRASLAFFDRREELHLPGETLPAPVIKDGDRIVRIPGDPVSALCAQCHAADSTGQAGSGDDRTCIGVHEGLSCAACHQKHDQNARQSCARCHPSLSNCGLDVAKMDTSFASVTSRNNIHRVRCDDCHPGGRPASIRQKAPDRSKL